MTEKQCGTCDWFVFSQRSYCGWPWCAGDTEVSTAFKAGGEAHAVWVNDGKDCPTWKAIDNSGA